ncbi:MAG: aldo/keto reductase [Chloroflexi bacterium]|nr:aldo/keto reductase [Chloroflexota bacterium]
MSSTGTNGIPQRPLGTTGVSVSMLCLGGFHLSVPPEEEATRIIHTAIDSGITFMDNAWEYADHESERRMGNALAQDGYRDKVFLMTKNCAHDRTAANSMVKLEESLRRLQTDHLDLWQIHEVTFPDDPDRIFASGGAAEAMLKAKEDGKVRFIGFTGHKSPSIFRRMLSQGFPWDTLQMPVSVLDANFNSFQKEIIPIAQEQGVGVIGMKSLAAGRIFDDPTIDITAEEAIRYALSQPIASLCTGIDSMAILEQNLRIARDFVPMTAEEQSAAIDKVFHHAWAGQHEPFKTSFDFEGNEARREHGIPLKAAAAD